MLRGPLTLQGGQGSGCKMKMQWFAEIRVWRMPHARLEPYVLYLMKNLIFHVKGDGKKWTRRPAQNQHAESEDLKLGCMVTADFQENIRLNRLHNL